MAEIEKQRRFPIMHGARHEKFWLRCGCPRSIPWALIAPHERQAEANHSQSLRRLAQRGGLCPSELLAVLQGKPWREIQTDEVAVWAQLRPLLEPDRSESGP